MKLDVFSVVILVFCVGICVTLAVEVRTLFKAQKSEVLIAESR
jgi:hypothetical protein